MKKADIRLLLMTLLLLFVLGSNLTAMGSRENSKAYKLELQQVFDELVDEIYLDETDAHSAKNRLGELRTKYDINYTDEAGILDAIIDRAVDRSLTPEETQFYFGLLQEGKLMKYRQETYRASSEQYKRELISLLQNQIETLSVNGGEAKELLTSLNNYYDFVGLEYDEEYFMLKELILSLREGRITTSSMTAELDSIDKQLIKSRNLRMAQERADSQSQGSGVSQSRSPSASGSENKSHESSPQSSGSGSSKPSKNNAGSHK